MTDSKQIAKCVENLLRFKMTGNGKQMVSYISKKIFYYIASTT